MIDASKEKDQEEESENKEKIQELIVKINENPYDFLSYQQLIEIYRNQGDLDELRQVRETLHQHYCLPVDMWIEWLEDEEKLYQLTLESAQQSGV